MTLGQADSVSMNAPSILKTPGTGPLSGLEEMLPTCTKGQ